MTEPHVTLAQPFTLPNGQTVPNRLLKSAMSETLGSPDNRPTDAHVRLYRRWAEGGIGLAITGNVMVDRRALGEPGNVAVEDERDLEQLRAWAAAGQAHGGRIWMQLNHPGRQVPKFLNAESVAPSAVPFRKEMQAMFATPRELTEAEIEDIVQRFARSAAIAETAGFDGVQIHGAHGYLVSQFLSPRTNLRTDRWGGSAENRRRFAEEIYRAIRGATSDGFGVSIKINSADFQKGGLGEDESVETIVALAEKGLDFIEISGGNYEAPAMMSRKPGPVKESTKRREAFFLEFAERLRGQMSRPLVLTGGFRSGAAMADAVTSGAVDMVGLARTLAVDPDFPNKLLTDAAARLDLPSRTTGFRAIDRMAMIEITWYELQLHRMGAGKETKPHANPLLSAISYGMSNGLGVFRTRRAR